MGSYEHHHLEGVDIYLHPGLVLSAPALTLRCLGFWRFSWLRVEGVVPPQACCI
ncbi:MAG: hypothetical protein HY910_14740 [Desulfarculus sp.]|nr:hypothetical protein [Desulfarculus sp.]